MIKSSILACRAIPTCQILSWFSIRPYTREQRLIKALKKQEERLERKSLREQDFPIVLQSQLNRKLGTSRDHVASRSLMPRPQHTTYSTENTLPDPEVLKQIDNQPQNEYSRRLYARCAGCGASLHCEVPGTHGFLPEPELVKLIRNETAQSSRRRVNTLPILCARCQLINQRNTLMGDSLSSEKYETQVVAELNNQKNSTILLIADMTNLPHSVVPLRLTNPSFHKIVLIGNKVDQLPIDGPKFHLRWSRALLDAFVETSGLGEDSVSHTALVSALTGYGVQRLLDFLLSKKFGLFGNPVYIIGSTNTGKSSLFNKFLLSDLCKSEARNSIRRATVSFWPGTTVGLLKFPLARMSFVTRAVRNEAKYVSQHTFKAAVQSQDHELYGYKVVKEEDEILPMAPSNINARVDRVRSSSQDLSAMPTFRFCRESTGTGDIVDSSMGLQNMLQVQLGVQTTIERDQAAGNRVIISETLDSRHYNARAWCYDTPGLASPSQSLNFLSREQLIEYLSLTSGKKSDFHHPERRFLLPRTFVLRPNLTMLIGRLGRLDVLASDGPVYLTTQTRLPVHIVETSDVSAYWTEYALFLGPGCTSAEGTSDEQSIPPMASIDLETIYPLDLEQSVADVVLSGAGWVSVSGVKGNCSEDEGIRLRAWTPGGVGVCLRRPPLLPYAIRRRGARLLYLREYSGLSPDAKFAQYSPS